MLRLIKLAFYAAIGYVIYELYQGMQMEMNTQGSGGGRRGRSSGSQASRQNITGEGEGMATDVADQGGGMRQQTVGRGVVH